MSEENAEQLSVAEAVAGEPEATADEHDAAVAAAEPAEGDAEGEPEPEPEKPAPQLRRQSLALRSGSCDLRIGPGAADKLGGELKAVVGKPRLALLVTSADVPAELAEYERRSLVDAGFSVERAELPAGRAARSLVQAEALLAALAAAGLSADDAIACVGSADAISTCVYVASTWRGGCALAAVPTELDGVVEVSMTPRALDLASTPGALLARGNVRLLLADTSLISGEGAGALMGRAVMVAGAVMAGESTFSELALRTEAIVGGDAEGMVDAIADLARARCRIVSSSAMAIRQGAGYGMDFARALRACLPAEAEGGPSDAQLLAEGLRIASRLAAARQGPESKAVDLVFAQDALLDRMGLPELPCEASAQELLDAFKACAQARSNRIMPALPLDYGRVRLTSVEDDVLLAHLGAWCKMRRRLARRQAKQAAE